MENEIFCDIENYEGLYQISSFGRVYSVRRGKFLKPKKCNGKYLQVGLRKNGKQKWYLVHRLVASAFLENPSNLQDVNHRDENPSNNRVENLEWMSHKENINYGTRTQRQKAKLSKVVQQFTKQGEFVAEFPSLREASRQTRINLGHIFSCCNGRYKSTGGFVWRYKQKEEAA